jgi:hypothetical protein
MADEVGSARAQRQPSAIVGDRPAGVNIAPSRSRRRFLIGTAALGAAAAAGVLDVPQEDDRERAAYDAAARAIWRHSAAADLPWPVAQRELARYGTLAASNHNSQPWRFRLPEQGIVVLPEFGRQGPVEDYDGHELFVSLGCAVENIVQAADAFGFRAAPTFDARTGGMAIALDKTAPRRTPLFEAIPQRRSAPMDYDAKPVPSPHLRLLEGSGNGDGVKVLLYTQPHRLEQILGYVLAAIDAQMDDEAFAGEFLTCVRFNYRAALATRDGLFVKCLGLPSDSGLIGRLLFDLGTIKFAQKHFWSGQIRSSAGIAVLMAERNDPVHWIEAGRCGQRFALQATALGIQNAFMCYPLETRAVIPQLTAYLGIGRWSPVAMIRFGYGPPPTTTPRSLRRPVEQMIHQA